MRPNFRASAPSSTLLKFLRAQSEGVCFFSSNPRGFVFDHAAPRGAQTKPKSIHAQQPTASRRLSTSSSRLATVEAGFLNFDAFWPRADPTTSQLTQLWSPQTRYSGTKISKLPGAQRYASKRNGPWLRRLWALGDYRLHGLKHEDLPYGEDVSESSMFTIGRSMSAKGANEPKLRCTEFDENGNVVLVNGEFKKSELIAKVRPVV